MEGKEKKADGRPNLSLLFLIILFLFLARIIDVRSTSVATGRTSLFIKGLVFLFGVDLHAGVDET